MFFNFVKMLFHALSHFTMRTLFLFTFALLVVISSCKKGGNDTPTPKVPTITSYNPTSAEVGATVTITGTNFSTTTTDNIVQFNGIDAIVTNATATDLTVTVPSGTTTGKITVSVGGLSATSAGNFTVLKWLRKADFAGDGRNGAAVFVIGNKGYLGTGNDNTTDRKDFWEYDVASNTWTQKADFGGTARFGAVGFAIGSKGYIGTGREGAATYIKDFWEYDPANNTWTKKADFAGVARCSATSFVIGSKGYIGIGYDGSTKKDFWEYDATNNTWTQKTDFGGAGRAESVGFAIGNKGYIGTGSTSSGPQKDFWEYDATNNTWTQKADFGGAARSTAAGFAIGNKGYIGAGSGPTGSPKDFWEYDPASNAWTQKADFGGSGIGGFSLSIGTRGYVVAKELWVYVP